MFENVSIHTVIHVVVALLFPPFLLGVINRVKAIFGGRRGQPLLQAYFDLRKLFNKESVFSVTTTWVFRFGPVVGLAAAWIALMIVPLGHPSAPLSFAGDMILLAVCAGTWSVFYDGCGTRYGIGLRRHGLGARSDLRLSRGTRHVSGVVGSGPRHGNALDEWLAGDRIAGRLERGGVGVVVDSVQLVHRVAGRELSHPIRRPEHSPRIDNDSRSHGARSQRSGVGADPVWGSH